MQRQVPDLVQKQRSFACRFEHAGLPPEIAANASPVSAAVTRLAISTTSCTSSSVTTHSLIVSSSWIGRMANKNDLGTPPTARKTAYESFMEALSHLS
ncbi:hypothetical protein P4U99_00590 [Brevibacillus agri]|uniref:hypothetical protein n=1 Tax=Brevibacillus agri TaxID=51101 RepID=UPI002E222380|nr:hypothetical protein [Brevibacillus agri]MED1654330.1 hypothetical protein [Brevibacillus agri]MED1686424.1 hypothetical protein [Brevibacillus agri]MED1694676.1 hypothetical protein [Brevibacillus agri]MED1696591.1 hypothetical protein [Brevibacillus agri]